MQEERTGHLLMTSADSEGEASLDRLEREGKLSNMSLSCKLNGKVEFKHFMYKENLKVDLFLSPR